MRKDSTMKQVSIMTMRMTMDLHDLFYMIDRGCQRMVVVQGEWWSCIEVHGPNRRQSRTVKSWIA